mgnify:CR=1 FL=1
MDILTNTISLLFRPRQKEIAKFAQDADAIQAASGRLKEYGEKVTIVRSNYRNIKEVLSNTNS